MSCGHRLCDLVDGGATCSIASGRSRGCRPNAVERDVAAPVLDEVRALVAAIAAGGDVRAAAVRLAQLVRQEAREDRHLVAIARAEDLDFAPALARLCARATA